MLFLNTLLKRGKFAQDLGTLEAMFPIVDVFTNYNRVRIEQLSSARRASHNPLTIGPGQVFAGCLIGADASLNLDAMSREERELCQDLGEYWVRKKVFKEQCVSQSGQIIGEKRQASSKAFKKQQAKDVQQLKSNILQQQQQPFEHV